MSIERRKHPRVKTSLSGEAVGDIPVFPVITEDISLSGLLCTATSHVPKDTLLSIKLRIPQQTRPDRWVTLESTVIRVNPEQPGESHRRYTLALEFTKIEDVDRNVLSDFLKIQA